MKLKALVAMSPMNAQLCIATPLYPRSEEKAEHEYFNLTYIQDHDIPLAYVLDMNEHGLVVVSADWANEKLELLGDL